ncbi:MAG TPA: c-type cytochrome [Bradyrhizobium sp.]|uniref:c-type cytochrome n=1 Tax=Bradyrhizobium sp. TaxID=376 RepID=UPI002D082E1E|nr:c-type cytochrome [Bradyrhizobium sp.]HLZ01192.1 c-type cytochrome [Bradyrhizobium sp.]
MAVLLPARLTIAWRALVFGAALLPGIAAFAFTATGRADGGIIAVAARGGIEGKLVYCKTCHGLSGEGYRGWFPMPRLAGQQPQYIEAQLRAFIERRRTNPVMQNVAHVLSPSMVSALAADFKHLDPPPIGGAPRRSLALGKEIFDNGLPESNVPACSACHGAEAKGENEIPRLAGQLYEYTVGQLTNWSRVRGQGTAVDTSAIMAPTAHNLTRAQIEAVAAYVGTLR